MACAAGTLVHPLLGPVVFLLLTTTVLRFGFRTLVKMWIASVMLGFVLFALAKPDPVAPTDAQQKQKIGR